MWVWEESQPPEPVAVNAPTTTVPEYPVLEPGQELPLGETRRVVYELYGYCGDLVWLAAEWWEPAESTYDADYPDEWLVRVEEPLRSAGPTLFGTATRIAPERVEVRSHDGDLVAVLERSPVGPTHFCD